MKVEYRLENVPLDEVAAITRKVEAAGFHGLVSADAAHDPFLSLAAAALSSGALSLGTSVAIAFARSPFVTAQIAWDLQQLSKGRFILGLGTQVKGHNERRFSVPWGPPGPRLREYILALRAIWDNFQTGAKLNYQGQYYTHTLMAPMYSPGPIAHPHIPIQIAAVNPYNLRLAGELCDGVRLHPASTPRYTREVVLPNIEAGAQKAGRSVKEVQLMAGPLVTVARNDGELAQAMDATRKRLIMYASVRTYTPVFELHGWADVVPKLHELSKEGKWDKMAMEINDEMVDTFAIVATRDKLAEKIKTYCGDVISGIRFTIPLKDQDDVEYARCLIQKICN